MLLLALACADPKPTPTPVTCLAADDDTRAALVTDIDGTLTLSDDEFLTQMDDPSYEPEARPEAAELLQDYAALGWRTIYISGRGEELVVADGRSAREATVDWLSELGFPLQDPDDLFLAEGEGTFNPIGFKAGVIADLQDDDFHFDYGYGNASTDIEAFLRADLDPTHLFLVGEDAVEAADLGVVPLEDADAYGAHRASWMGSVPCAETAPLGE